jgi:hypothetical protein
MVIRTPIEGHAALKRSLGHHGVIEGGPCGRRRTFETLVHFALGSDYIHVAILPAPRVAIDKRSRQIRRIDVLDIAFTAFMWYGYDEQRAADVFNDDYDYMFMPVFSHREYALGLDFLCSLQGHNYNYADLFFAVLPSSWKHRYNKPCEDGRLPQRVFCSQVGLMLCYTCRVVGAGEDPASCNPGELYDFVKNEASGIVIDDRSLFRVILDDASSL